MAYSPSASLVIAAVRSCSKAVAFAAKRRAWARVFISSPHLRLPKYFQVTGPAVHGNLAPILRRRAVLPGKRGADGIGKEFSIIGDAVRLRSIVDANTVVMN